MHATDQPSRVAAVISGKRLEYFSVGWHLLEGGLSLLAGLASGSLSLVGFGIDSLIELASGATMLWRLGVDQKVAERERNEKLALQLVGWSFIALAVYLIFEAIVSFAKKRRRNTALLELRSRSFRCS